MSVGPVRVSKRFLTAKLLTLAVLVVAGLAILPATASAFVYWTNYGTNTIGRANLDGSGANQSFITGASIPYGIAVDAGHVYWVNVETGSIGRANLDGSGANQSFIASAGNPYQVGGVAVDAEHIYWANLGTNSIGRANLDGSGANQSFITGLTLPTFVAVDAEHIYWANLGTNTIGRANLDGSGANQSFITGANEAFGVAVDTGHVYWVNRGTGSIGRANLDGSGANQSFIAGAKFPYGLAVDASHVYWTNAETGTIGRANLDGSGADQSFIAGASTPSGVAVDENLPNYALNLSTTGEGTGSFQCDTGSGPEACASEYAEGTEVTVIANAGSGSEFAEFGPEGDCTGTGCELTMDEARTVNAVFDLEPPPPPLFPLTLTIEEGSGTVVSDPAGIECSGEAPQTCETESIAEGTVTLTASPASGYLFRGWRGCDPRSGEFGAYGRQCTIELNEAKEVGAKFVKSYDLTLSGSGPGKVSSKPGGALCLPNCTGTTAAFKEGTAVEAQAKPNKHFHLLEWGGDCSGSGACTVSMSADRTVSASFAEDTKYALSLAKQGGGQALIKTKPPGMVCAYACGSISASFYTGETVEVKWKLGKGTDSIEWSTGSGTCTGLSEAIEGTCMVTMSAARSLVAELE
jgi:virginiamycin B lyase